MSGSAGSIAHLNLCSSGDGLVVRAAFNDELTSSPSHVLLTLSREEAMTANSALHAWMGGAPLHSGAVCEATGFTAGEIADLPLADDLLRAMAALRGHTLVLPQPESEALAVR